MEDSLNYLIDNPDKSLIRIGDCEVSILGGDDAALVDYNPELSYRLSEIIKDKDKRIIIGFKDISLNGSYFWSRHFIINGRCLTLSHLWEARKNQVLINANIPYYLSNDTLGDFKKLWQDKEIVFITGKGGSFIYLIMQKRFHLFLPSL